MTKDRKTAILVGIFIFVAYSIIGTNNPDAKLLGMSLEVTSGLAVIAIAWLMQPYLQPFGKGLSLTYLLLKGLEGGLMIIGGLLFFIHTKSLLTLRDQIYFIHGYIFAVPALIFYFLLWRSSLVPRWLSVWGILAAFVLMVVNTLEALNVIPAQIEILYLPIVLNEVVLALWLILKGFNPAAIPPSREE